MLHKPAMKWSIRGAIALLPSDIELIEPILGHRAQGRLNAPASVSLSTVAMISGYKLSDQVAGSTSQATSWPLGYLIALRQWAKMMMMRTERILEHRAVAGVVLAKAMSMMTERVSMMERVERMGLGKGWEERFWRGDGLQQSTERVSDRAMGTQLRKGKGTGRQAAKGKVLLNKPQGRWYLLCCCFAVGEANTWRRYRYGGVTRVHISSARRITRHNNFFLRWSWIHQGVRQWMWLRTWFWCEYAHGK